MESENGRYFLTGLTTAVDVGRDDGAEERRKGDGDAEKCDFVPCHVEKQATEG